MPPDVEDGDNEEDDGLSLYPRRHQNIDDRDDRLDADGLKGRSEGLVIELC